MCTVLRSSTIVLSALGFFSCSPAVPDGSQQSVVPAYVQVAFDALRAASHEAGGDAWLITPGNAAFEATIENTESPINKSFARIPQRFLDGQAEYAALVVMPGVAVFPNDNYHAVGPAVYVALHSLPEGAEIEAAKDFTFGIPVTAAVPNALGSSLKVSVRLAKVDLTAKPEHLDQFVDAKFAISERAVTGTLVPVWSDAFASGWVNYKVEGRGGDLLCTGNIDFANTTLSVDYVTEHHFRLTAVGIGSVSVEFSTLDPRIPGASEVAQITPTFGEPRSMVVTCESGVYDLNGDPSVNNWGMVFEAWDWTQLTSGVGECGVTCTTKKGVAEVKGDFNYLGYNTVVVGFGGKFEGLRWTNPD